MVREMKESGVEWIQAVPIDWNLNRLKFLCNIKTGNKDTVNRVDNGDYDFFVRSPNVEKIDTYTFDGEAILTAGDGVGAGKVFHYANGKFDYHQRVYNLHNFRGISGEFLYYFMKVNFIKEVEKGTAKSTVDSIRLPMLQNFPICIPPLEEQQKITRFLNEKISQIDAILENTQQSIAELKKYKQSLITEAVTKGIKPNSAKKYSGAEWLGEIPVDWYATKTKYLFSIKKVIANEEGHPVLSVTQQGLKIKDLSKNEGQLATNYSKYQFVNVGDFVMNHMDLLTGWVDSSKFEGVTSPDYRVFKFKDSTDHSSDYYKYIFQMCYFNRIYYGLGQGVSNLGRWRLQTDKFINFVLPVPPLEEQKNIVTYLDTKCTHIDSLIEQKKQLLIEFKSYKKAFIYEYVTGKKEVV